MLRQEETLGRLEEFLGIPMARIPVREDSVGRWRSAADALPAHAFPPESIYHGLGVGI